MATKEVQRRLFLRILHHEELYGRALPRRILSKVSPRGGNDVPRVHVRAQSCLEQLQVLQYLLVRALAINQPSAVCGCVGAHRLHGHVSWIRTAAPY